MTKKILFAAAALGLAFAVPAAARDRSFTHEGVTYTYTSTSQPDGSVVIAGTASPLAGKFRLVVHNGRVTGEVDGRPVAFRVADNVKLGREPRLAER